MEQVPHSVKILAPHVDYHVEVHNAPNTDDIELKTPGETWETFKIMWMQTCAWIPDQTKMKEKNRLLESKLSSSLEILSSEASGSQHGSQHFFPVLE